MPIYDLGYREWKGRKSPISLRWLVIARNGFLLAWKSQWLRRMMFFAWLPTAFCCLAFFLYEQFSRQDPQWQVVARQLLEGLMAIQGSTRELPSEELLADRHGVWSRLLLLFFRYPQGGIMVLLVGLIAPPLICRDVRSRAFLLYFSRPISRVEYILGKSGTIWGYLFLITTAPALVLYFIGVVLSPSLSVVWSTWDLPFRIIIASGVLMIPTSAMALAFSSLANGTRMAGFMWFAVWVLGITTYGIVYGYHLESLAQQQWREMEQIQQTPPQAFDEFGRPIPYSEDWRQFEGQPEPRFEQESRNAVEPGVPNDRRNTGRRDNFRRDARFRRRGPPAFRQTVSYEPMPAGWSLLSIYHSLGDVQEYVFGLTPKFSNVAMQAGLLLMITLVSLGVVYYRISTPMRV